MKWGIVFTIAIVFGIGIGLSLNVSAEEGLIPSWIKNNAKWWAEDQIDDSTFIQGIQFLIKEEIIEITSTVQSQGSRETNIPDWIKNNAKWWAEDLLSESDFLNGIEFLVKEGIIQIPQDDLLVSTSTLTEKIQSCTRENFEYPIIDQIVLGDCLIEEAETSQDCQAYSDVVLVKIEIINSYGDIKQVNKKFDKMEECITKIALQNHDSTICNSLDNNTSCIIQFVQEFKTSETCNEADDSQKCFNQISIDLGPVACKKIGGKEGILNCVNYYFSSLPIREKIGSVQNNQSYNECIDGSSGIVKTVGCGLRTLPLNDIATADLLEWKSDGEMSVCLPFGFPSHIDSNDYCLASIGMFAKDLSVCDKAGTARAECYGFLADTEEFVTLKTCDKLETGVSFCYMHVAYRMNDISICDKTDTNKNNCINLVNSRSQ